MLSHAQVSKLFIEPLAAHKPNPPSDNAEQFFRDVAEALAGYSADVLIEARHDLTRTGKGGLRFPSVAECLDACKRHFSAGQPQEVAKAREWKSGDEERSEAIIGRQRRLEAIRMCRCALGRTAAKEGWLNAMLEFATDHGRLPDEREADRCRKLARRNEQSLEGAKGSPFYARLKALRQSMHERAYQDVFGFIEAKHAAE